DPETLLAVHRHQGPREALLVLHTSLLDLPRIRPARRARLSMNPGSNPGPSINALKIGPGGAPRYVFFGGRSKSLAPLDFSGPGARPAAAPLGRRGARPGGPPGAL